MIGQRISRETRWALLFFAGLTFLFYSPLLLGEAFLPVGFLYRTPLWYNPRVPLQQFDLFDAIIYFYPLQTLLSDALSQGDFPFWSPYNFAGHPVAFNGQSGFFYPPRLLLLILFPTWLAHGLSLALHTFVAGSACWFLARRLGLSVGASALFGVGWMFNPYVMGWLEMDFLMSCAAWTPLALLAVEQCMRTWRGAGWLALCLAMLLLAGHLQFVLYALITIFLVGLLLVLHSGTSKVVWLRLAVGGFLGALMSSPMLLPTAYYLSHSQRPKLGLDFLLGSYRQLLQWSLPSFVFPQAHGNGNDFAVRKIAGAGEFIFAESTLYFGTLILLLALSAVANRGLGRALMVTAVVVLVVPATPLYSLVQWLPGLDRINSTRFLQVVHFLVVLAAAFGFDALEHVGRPKKLAAGSAGLFGLGAVWATGRCSGNPATTVIELLQTDRLRLPKRDLFLSDDAFLQAAAQGADLVYSWSNPAIWMPLFVLLATTVLLLSRLSPQRWIPVLLALELLVAGRAVTPHHPVELLYQDNPTLSQLGEASPERVMGVGSIKPNTLLPFGIRDIAGYDSFYPPHTSQYLAFLMRGVHDPKAQLPAQVFPINRYQSPLADLMGVRYYLAYPGQNLEGKTLVMADPLPVFENPDRVPQAFLVNQTLIEPDTGKALSLLDDPAFEPTATAILPTSLPSPLGTETGTAEVLHSDLNQVTVETKSEETALLVLSEGYAEGWTVEVTGQEVPLLRANVMFRAVVVPPGTQQVVFRFRPKYFSTGVVLGSLALLLTLLLLALGGNKLSLQHQG